MALTRARRRGLYPEPAEPLYLSDTEEVTIRLPTTLWHWLKNAVGTTSSTFSVEETIQSALQSLAGPQADLGMNGAAFIAMAADCRNVSHAEALFGPMDPEQERQVGILLEAARAASLGPASFASLVDDKDDPAETAAILGAWLAVAGTDIAAAVEQERQQQQEEYQRQAEELMDELEVQFADETAVSRSPGTTDDDTLDDDIPI